MDQFKREGFKELNKNSNYLMQMCDVSIDEASQVDTLVPLKEFKGGGDNGNHVQDIVKWIRNNPEELTAIAYRESKGRVKNLYIIRIGWKGGVKQQTMMKID